MKNILVPTNFSECADYATQVAISLAAKNNAIISFLHIMPNPNDTWHIPRPANLSTKSQEKVQARNNLALLVKKASEAGVLAKQFLVFDKGNEKIENYIDPLGIDFIVMGSHGATGIREMVLGSNTQRTLRHAHVPVLVVKHSPNKPFQIKNIVFASSFEGNDLGALKLITDMARLWQATLNVLFITMQDKQQPVNQQKIIDQLQANNPSLKITSSSIEVNDEEWGIHQFAKLIDADIITLTTHDHHGVLVQRNVAEELANHEDLPVLVIHS